MIVFIILSLSLSVFVSVSLSLFLSISVPLLSLSLSPLLGCVRYLADIMIVADESRSISHTFMIRLKEFVLDLARQFPVSDTQIHVGVMRFSTPERTQVDIKVNQITNKTELITAIDNIPFEGDGRGAATYHMLAMMTALEELQKNGRKNVDDVIILVTDGSPQPDTQSARSIAAEARKNGTTIYGVYVGTGQMAEEGRAEIRNISDRAFEVDDFNALGSIVNDVTSEECQSELLLSSNCMSRGFILLPL